MTTAATTPPIAPERVGRALRLRTMDALRFVAALSVVLFHFTARDHVRWGALPLDVFPALSGWTRYGYAGVHLFFVISGFVIAMSVRGRTPAQFIASRVARLFPAYWAAVLLTATLRWLWPTFGDRSPVEVLVNLTMLQDLFGVARVDGVYWTLWVELQFYALVLLALLVGLDRRRWLLGAAVLPPLCTSLTLALPAAAGVVTLLGFAPLFAAGVVLHVIHRDGGTWHRWVLLAATTAQGAVLAGAHQAEAIDHITSGGPTSRLVLALVVVVAVALVAVTALVPAVRDVDLRVLTWAGALTYPLYLVHEYVGWAVIEVAYPTLPRWATLTLAVAVCLTLAGVLHRVVERPLARPLRTRVERWCRACTPKGGGATTPKANA